MEPPCCQNMEDLAGETFFWQDKTILALLSFLGREFLLASALCSATGTFATFFSGLGTAEMAWLVLHLSLAAHGLPFLLQPGFSCESDLRCQDVLRKYTNGPIVSDIMSLLHVSGNYETDDFQQLYRAMMTAGVRSIAWCCRQMRYVVLGIPTCTSSGVPCQDFSRAGKQEGSNDSKVFMFRLILMF